MKALVVAALCMMGCARAPTPLAPDAAAVVTTQARVPVAAKVDSAPSRDADARRVALLHADQDFEAAKACSAPVAECDALALRAARVYEEHHSAAKALAAYGSLRDAANVREALYHVGSLQRDTDDFDRAATSFERFASESPTSENAPSALIDALVIRLALGDAARSKQDADRFFRAYTTTRADDAATIAFAMNASRAERDEWAVLERELPTAMPMIERGPTYVRMMAHALLGRAYAKHAGDKRASAEYARVRALRDKLTGSFNDPPAQLKQWAKGLDVLGEAMVFAADEKRAAVVWPRLPAFSGSDADVDAWIATKVQPWIAARSQAITTVEAEYKKVLELPVPPPRWVVEAGQRVAVMWADASDELTLSPHPRAARSFQAKVDAAARPLRDAKAKPAAKSCVAFSAKYQISTPASDACVAWLTKHFRSEAPPLDELVPQMRQVRAGDVEPIDPLYARASDYAPTP